MDAHQYIRRLETQARDLAQGNSYWETLDLDLKNSVVKEIDLKTAREIIEEYEYLGCVAAVNWHQYGIFFVDKATNEEVCGGVVIFGQEYAENRGVWDKYDFTGNIILLNRGVCLHWAPINTNSKLIMDAIKQLPPKYEVITCTIDPDAGEIGTIYQACNFHYVGVLRKNKKRLNFVINGKKYGSRSIRQKYGTMSKKLLPDLVKEKLGKDATIEFVEVHSKGRYFYFNCNKRKSRYYRNKIKDIIKPYQKRDECQM